MARAGHKGRLVFKVMEDVVENPSKQRSRDVIWFNKKILSDMVVDNATVEVDCQSAPCKTDLLLRISILIFSY